MLELRPNCDCRDRDLPPDSEHALICSFECTFCTSCAARDLGGVCLNCGGELLKRPRRPSWKLADHPASTVRIFKPRDGAQAAGTAKRKTDAARHSA